MTPEVRQENRIVADWLLFADERRIKYQQLREDIELGGEHKSYVMVRQDSAPSDPTAVRAIKLTELEHYERWLALVDEVERTLPPKMQVFLKVRRECRHRRNGKRGRPAWIPYVQRRYAEEWAKVSGKEEEDVWIEDRGTLWRWWVRIIDYAARLAAKRGLI